MTYIRSNRLKTAYSGLGLGECVSGALTRRKIYRSRQSWRVCIVALAPHSRKRVCTVDLPELLFGLALLLALAVPALWWAVPILLLGYTFVRKAEGVANDVRDTSPPGDGFALWGGIFTIAAAGVVVVAVLLAVGSVAGAI